ncbi:hypothetical protein H5410_019287 [Solanum commersonii]|uniref:Uncharacterized protein n=1 Tax=Solanum commersonii TaxID=4109 RepID=A0A9J6A5W3_SOLCO|nr:hypothetical protein H5410_019287 [Solanum commersonii]
MAVENFCISRELQEERREYIKRGKREGKKNKVLMFPILLDDSYLASEFETFIDTIDKTHELTLGGHQQYPGVYALLFHKGRRARSIGLRLAGRMSKLSKKNVINKASSRCTDYKRKKYQLPKRQKKKAI